MKRRYIAFALAAMPWLAHPAWAAGEPTEGKDYTRLQSAVPLAVPGKIEVIEFFGYWCPHCNSLEPKLEAWIAKLPPDVNFRRIPVGWQAMHVPYQKLFFALEALGLGGEIHQKVFNAVHVQGLHLEVDAGITSFAASNGIDKAKLLDAMNGFTVASRLRMANQLFGAYHVEGVPTLAVNGRFVTSPEQAGGEEKALQVADALVRLARSSH